jgi:hypothetical protein
MVHVIPVFGEKGALMEHWIFDTFFNRPQKFAKWAAPRMRGLLTGWMIFGLILTGLAFHTWPEQLTKLKPLVNTVIGATVLFLLPRLLFYPLMMKKKHRPAKNTRL